MLFVFVKTAHLTESPALSFIFSPYSLNLNVKRHLYDPYTKLYIQEFLRNVLIPWNTDGHLDLSSRIESGFSLDSFLGLYSDGGNHTRVLVVLYAHGHILS